LVFNVLEVLVVVLVLVKKKSRNQKIPKWLLSKLLRKLGYGNRVSEEISKNLKIRLKAFNYHYH
jgi:histone H3/H4